VLAAAAMLVAVLQGPLVVRFLGDPIPFFARTKTLHDVRGVTAAVAASSQGLPAGTRWLLLVERQSVPNAVLDRYLHWWGLDDRVLFRGTRDVPSALRLLADPAMSPARLAAPPLATIPVGLTDQLRAFLGIAADTTPVAGPFGGVTVVAWEPPAGIPGSRVVRNVLYGAQTFVPAAGGSGR
jgi:hypothetical protein